MSKINARQDIDGGAGKLARPLGGLALLVLMFVGAACSSGPDPKADQSFLTDEPCAAPCWHGLELGTSTKAQALSLLPTLAFVNAGSIADRATTWQGDNSARQVTFGCVHPRTNNCGSAIFAGDKLRWLELSVGYTLSMRMVVDKIGAPTLLDYSTGNTPGCSVTAAWPGKNIAVVLDGLGDRVCQSLGQGQGVPETLKVTSLHYTEAQILQAGPDSCCGRLAWPGFSKP